MATLSLTSDKTEPIRVVQIISLREDSEYHEWYDICIDMLPPDKAADLSKIIEIFDRIGDKKETFVLCYPTEYGKSENLTKDETKKVREFNVSEYSQGTVLPDEMPRIITGRFVLQNI